MRKMMLILIAVALSLALVSLEPEPAAAPARVSAADFFKNKTVTLIVDSKPGGDKDFVARAFASRWSNVAGGRMMVRNEDGGGGTVATNLVYGAKPDGLTLGSGQLNSMLTSVLLAGAAVRYDITKFSWIGRVCSEPYGFEIGMASRYKTLEDLKKGKRIKFVTSDPESPTAMALALIIDIFGLDATITPGFRSADRGLAASRGEVDGFVENSSIARGNVEKGFVQPPFFVVSTERSAWFPNTPALTELINLSPEQERALKLFVSLEASKDFYGPPDLPEDVLQLLRHEYFDKIAAMPVFKEMVGRVFTVWAEPVQGEKVVEIAKAGMKSSKEDIAWFKKQVRKYGTLK